MKARYVVDTAHVLFVRCESVRKCLSLSVISVAKKIEAIAIVKKKSLSSKSNLSSA